MLFKETESPACFPRISRMPAGESSLTVDEALESAERSGDRRPATVQNAIRWATKGGFAVLEQGLISGSNFLLAILLARWLTPAGYGAYALAFSMFLLALFIYQALVLEPLLVFGGAAGRTSLRPYLSVLVRISSLLLAAMFGALGAAAIVLRFWTTGSSLPGALAGAAVAGPGVMIFWLARRVVYLNISVAWAAAGAFIYCLALASGLFLLEWSGLVSPFSAFLLMGLAAVITCAAMLRRLLSSLPAGGPAPDARATWRKHWRYGRWALAGSIASWIPVYIYYPLLGSIAGMSQAGELRGLMNFAQPLGQFYAALSMVFLPYAARVNAREGLRRAGRTSLRISAFFILASVAYWTAVILLRGQALHLLYGDKYAGVAHLIPAMAVGSVLWSATFGSSIVLRGMGSTSSIFLAFCPASFVSVAVGLPLMRTFGISGAVWAMNISDAVALLMLIWLLRRQMAAARPSFEALVST